jgi:hypothetical protein
MSEWDMSNESERLRSVLRTIRRELKTRDFGTHEAAEMFVLEEINAALAASPEPEGETLETNELEIGLRNDMRYKAPEQMTKTLTYHICLLLDRLKKMEQERNTLLAKLADIKG